MRFSAQVLSAKSSSVSTVWPQYRDDYRGFCREVLGIRPWSMQRAIASSVIANKRTYVSACHGPGKTYTAASIFLWWLYTREPSTVIFTAPTLRQAKDLLWAEVRKMHAGSLQKLGGKVNVMRIELAPKWIGYGFASRNPDSAQGVHAENVLLIFDEASGIKDDIHEAMQGALTASDARELAMGNPVSNRGWFRDAFKKRQPGSNCVYISALRTPNVRAGKALIPGMVEREWVDDARAKYGEDHPFWRTRVLGQFFESDGGEKVIPQAWADEAQKRWDDATDQGEVILAADIARSGADNTAIVLLRGRRLTVLETLQIPDTMEVAERIVQWSLRENPDAIHIDATGLGVGVYDRLRQIQDRLGEARLVGVVLGAAAQDREAFPRLLDEMQWAMRGALDPRGEDPIAIDPRCPDLAEQLSVRGWYLDDRTRIKVESKNDLRRRGAHSPDVADAAMLCFHRTEKVWWM
jgi:phage terminase large subunit